MGTIICIFPLPFPPVLEAILAIPASGRAKTPVDTPSPTLLLGKIRMIGNTSPTLYSFPLIQVNLYLQYFATFPPKKPMEAVTYHATPDSPWDSIDAAMLAPYTKTTELWEEAQAIDDTPFFPSEDLEDTTTNPDIP